MSEIYKVKSGENLTVIAGAALGDKNRWPEIAHLNSISHPYIIYPGQILELPPDIDSDIVEVQLTTDAAAPVWAGFSFSPATVILLIAGAALFLWRK